MHQPLELVAVQPDPVGVQRRSRGPADHGIGSRTRARGVPGPPSCAAPRGRPRGARPPTPGPRAGRRGAPGRARGGASRAGGGPGRAGGAPGPRRRGPPAVRAPRPRSRPLPGPVRLDAARSTRSAWTRPGRGSTSAACQRRVRTVGEAARPLPERRGGTMKTDELADRLLGSTLGALDVLTVHVGDQFGLYDAAPPGRSADRGRAGGAQRDAPPLRAGVGRAADRGGPARGRGRLGAPPRPGATCSRRSTPSVLTDPDDLAYLAPLARMIAAAASSAAGPDAGLPHRPGRRLARVRARDEDRTGRHEPALVPLRAGQQVAAGRSGGACRRSRRARTWPTWAAGRAGPRSGWRCRTPTSRWTATTSTSPRWSRPAGTPRSTASTTGCGSTSWTSRSSRRGPDRCRPTTW